MSSELKYIIQETFENIRQDIHIITLEARIAMLEYRMQALETSQHEQRAALATPAQEGMNGVRPGLCHCCQCEARREGSYFVRGDDGSIEECLQVEVQK